MTGPNGTTEYHYNGFWHLTAVSENGITKQYFVYPSGLGNVVGEYDNNGSLLTRYTHGLGLIGQDDYFYSFAGSKHPC